jgi:hypothetical protein
MDQRGKTPDREGEREGERERESPGMSKIFFSSPNLQTSSVAHLASYSMRTSVLSRG